MLRKSFYFFLFFISLYSLGVTALDELLPEELGQSGLLIRSRLPPAELTVESNLPEARWILYLGDKKIYTGRGTEKDLTFPPASGYRIRGELQEGYVLEVDHPHPFDLEPRRTFLVRLSYQRKMGFIDLSTLLPDGEIIDLYIAPKNDSLRSQHIQLQSEKGKIFWKSNPLPTGEYVIKYKASSKFIPVDPVEVKIIHGEREFLTPEFVDPKALHLDTNIKDAAYYLKRDDTEEQWEGSGQRFTFPSLLPGSYTLYFLTPRSNNYIPPDPVRIRINKFQDVSVSAEYQPSGQLLVTTNVDPAHVILQEVGGKHRVFHVEVTNGKGSFNLPEGSYRLFLEEQKPIHFEISQGQTKNVGVSSNGKVKPPKEASIPSTRLILTTNTPSASYTIRESGSQKEPHTYSGIKNIIHLKPNVKYDLLFKEIPNYKTPLMTVIELKPDEQRTLNIDYTSIQHTVKVEANGEKFAMGQYEVTNSQYAAWLNEASKRGEVVLIREGSQRGFVKDREGYILFKTWDADSNSQIGISKEEGKIIFVVVPGKDRHPVIFVSWYGAKAFCNQQQCRLPTEREWEIAAAWKSKDSSYKYAFGKDSIDRAWANYGYIEGSQINVRTREVGFYNGINKLPLGPQDRNQMITQNAQSPFGAYDMSGNVREWVEEAVTKGGSYASEAPDLEIKHRTELPREATDAFTGFRVLQP